MKLMWLSEVKGTLLFISAMFLNFIYSMDRGTVTFILGSLSSICVTIFYCIKIYRLIKKKRDVGKSE